MKNVVLYISINYLVEMLAMEIFKDEKNPGAHISTSEILWQGYIFSFLQTLNLS